MFSLFLSLSGHILPATFTPIPDPVIPAGSQAPAYMGPSSAPVYTYAVTNFNDMHYLPFLSSLAPPLRAPLRRIKAEVVLGSPGARCRGVGICRITAIGQEAGAGVARCRKTVAWIGATPGGRLYMVFSKHLVCPQFAARQFVGSQFPVDSRFEWPAFVQDKLGGALHTIEPGQYPMRENAQQWVVYFS